MSFTYKTQSFNLMTGKQKNKAEGIWILLKPSKKKFLEHL